MADNQPGRGPVFVYPLPKDPNDLISDPRILWRVLESLTRRAGGPGSQDQIFYDQSFAATGDATLAEVAASTDELERQAQDLEAAQQSIAAVIDEDVRLLRSEFLASRAQDSIFGEGEVQQEINQLRSELSALRALVDAERGADHVGTADLTAATPIIYDGHGGFSLNTVPIGQGGTGAITATLARTALGLAIGANVFTQRTLTGTANEITVANGDGTGGNPTFSLPAALTFTGKTVTDGTFNIASVTATGSVQAGSAGIFGWSSSSRLAAPSDGVITLSDNAQATFARLQFGGTTASFPALKRSSAALEVKLADDSAYAAINFGIPTYAGTNTTGAGSAALGANCPAVTLTAPYKWLQITTADGSTAYIPAWK